MTMMRELGLLVALVALAACGTAPAGDGPTPPTESPTTSVVVRSTEATPPSNAPTTDVSSPTGEEVLIRAIKDLARRLDVSEAEIEVESASDGYWNDASIGCPVEGDLYAQLIVDGFRVELRADGSVYVYHQGGTEPVFLCESPDDDAFVPGKTIPEPSIPPPRE